NAISITIQTLLERFYKRGICFNQDIATEYCFQYLIEECTMMASWAGLGYNYAIYPGERSPAMTAIYELLIKPCFPDELKWIRINFKKKAKPSFDSYHHQIIQPPHEKVS